MQSSTIDWTSLCPTDFEAISVLLTIPATQTSDTATTLQLGSLASKLIFYRLGEQLRKSLGFVHHPLAQNTNLQELCTESFVMIHGGEV